MHTANRHLPLIITVTFTLLLAFGLPAGAPAFARSGAALSVPVAQLNVPYVPTPQAVVDKMLEIANVTGADYVIDLGSGDGRIPITAAKRFGSKAMGVDLDPIRIQEAKAHAVNARVTDKVEFKQQDLFKTDISKATVLTMYLLPRVNMELRPRILSELKPGTRVVSHSFDMGDWKPDKTVKVDGRTIHLWIVPDPAQQRSSNDAR
jgi:2-polyprenyl-3-methyl-5-hydroxy-6-metoxy-1,4-benzoquinol methylase